MLPLDLSQLHFAHPLWLWALLAIPLVWVLFFRFYQAHHPIHQLEKFIDSHLLPYLLVNRSNKKSSLWKTLLLWSAVWSCLTLALTGPRWSFREIETFSKDQSLVILLDLSESMNATDTKPSRLVRAKQKIEDLINLSQGVKIGLIAFAADPHMITPITEDKETIRHLLPSLTTDLVYIQGSRLSPALEMASTMLKTEPGHNKALLVISDGGFEDASAITASKKIAEGGLTIHTMGVGTLEGAPLQDSAGNIIKKKGAPILSKLEKERLSEISKAGNGHYLEAHYSNQPEAMILKELEKRGGAQADIGKKIQLWEEGFYFLILPALPMILWWFRRGCLFALILLFFTRNVEAAPDYFKNFEELGKQALDSGDYETAIHTFQDPYRKGVACYRAGDFSRAEKLFRQSSREEVAASAAYNLGNSLVQQQKLKEAIAVYEDLLKRWPDHKQAQENLELVKKMLEQKQEEPPQNATSQENSSQQGDRDKDSEKSDQSESGEKPHNESKPQENQRNPEDQQQEPQGGDETEASQKEATEADNAQKDRDADLWLNQIANNDPQMFLKNKFYIESKKNKTAQGIDPW